MSDEIDLGLAIVRHAERQTTKRRCAPIWSFVSEMLCCGPTVAYRFCAEHLPKNGWKHIAHELPPEGVLVWTAEDLGDAPRKLKRVNGEWFDAKKLQMMYSPNWWKETK